MIPEPEPHVPGDRCLPERVADYIAHSDLRWSLTAVGEDQNDRLAQLTSALRGARDGTGKCVPPGAKSWGIVPAVAWERAQADPFYLVMRESVAGFTRSWHRIKQQVGPAFGVYISLGTGTGSKDRSLLSAVERDTGGQGLMYVSVDSGAEFLRLDARRAVNSQAVPPTRLAGVQMDISIPGNLVALKRFVETMFQEAPVLYSMLSNELANYADDLRVLRDIRTNLMRRQDRLLLELSTTEVLAQEHADQAADEYENSVMFQQYALSPLLSYTDIPMRRDWLDLNGTVEPGTGEAHEGRALLVNMSYVNGYRDDLWVTLPDWDCVPLRPGEGILLLRTRKYCGEGINQLLFDAGLKTLPTGDGESATRYEFNLTQPDPPPFGMQLMLLQRAPLPVEQPPEPSGRPDIWENTTAGAGHGAEP